MVGAVAVTLNKEAFNYAKALVEKDQVVRDERDDWSEHRPSAKKENEFIAAYGFGEYAKWYLGINDQANENTKGRYEFPYGDFEKVHRCGVLTVESRAGQYKHYDIENAAAHLHEMMDKVKHKVKH